MLPAEFGRSKSNGVDKEVNVDVEVNQKLGIAVHRPLRRRRDCHKLPTYVSDVTAFYDKGCPHNGIP